MSSAGLLRVIFGIGVLILITLPGAAPAMLSPFPLFLAGLSSAFGQICHQEPSRALLVGGVPSLLCARCLGAFAGYALVLLAPARLSKPQTLTALAVGASAWFLEAVLGPWPSEARLLAGSAIGLALAAPLAEACEPRILC